MNLRGYWTGWVIPDTYAWIAFSVFFLVCVCLPGRRGPANRRSAAVLVAVGLFSALWFYLDLHYVEFLGHVLTMTGIMMVFCLWLRWKWLRVGVLAWAALAIPAYLFRNGGNWSRLLVPSWRTDPWWADRVDFRLWFLSYVATLGGLWGIAVLDILIRAYLLPVAPDSAADRHIAAVGAGVALMTWLGTSLWLPRPLLQGSLVWGGSVLLVCIALARQEKKRGAFAMRQCEGDLPD